MDGCEPTVVKVSVSIITYNQEPYIGDAIDSVLMQRANFDYEIVVGDDGSTDRTREILLDRQIKHEGKIRLLFHEKNMGDYGRSNLVITLNACRGEYVAILDGDDYWTSSDKLQRQADFLDRHRECSACFHRFKLRDEHGRETVAARPPGRRTFYTLEDVLLGNFIGFSTTMFRRGLFELPAWYMGDVVGDWVVHVLNAEQGNIGFIDDVMTACRDHDDSMSHLGGGVWLRTLGIQTCLILKEQFGRKRHRALDCCVSRLYCKLAKTYHRQQKMDLARDSVVKALASFRFHRRMPWRELLFAISLVYFPRINLLWRFTKRAVSSSARHS